MNSRLEAGDGGFQVPGEKQIQQEFQFMGSWIPVTPEKPVQARSNLIIDNGDVNQVGGVNVQEPNGFPGGGGYTERTLYSNGAAQNLNQTEQLMNRNGVCYHDANAGLARRTRLVNSIAGSIAQTLNNNDMENLLARNNVAFPLAPVNRNPFENPGTVNNSFAQSGPQAGNYNKFDLEDLLSSDQIPCSFSRLLSDGDNLCRGPQYGLPASNQPLYNLNSLPRREANGSLSANSFHFVPPTPTQANRIESVTTPGSKFLAGDNFVQEKVYQESAVLTTGNEIIEHSPERYLQNTLDFSVVDSTKEQRDGSGQNDPVNDLDKTPQLKPHKRKKYMPKVVVEGKPKRKTQKPATPANAKSKETGNGKKKQTQKTNLKESASKEPNVVRETSDPRSEIPARSCRRVLNFDLEKPEDVRQGDSKSHQYARASTSVSEATFARTQIDQQIGMSIGTCPAGLSTGNQRLAGLLMGENQPALHMRNPHERLAAGDQQPRFFIGSQQCQLSTVSKQTQLPMGNQQLQFPMDNQTLGLPVEKRQPSLPMGNQLPWLDMGNQQTRLSTVNHQSGYLTGNQHSGFLNQLNQQIFSSVGGRQSGLPIGIQQNGLSRGGLQPGLVMKNWQHKVLMRDPQPGSLMRNQQPDTSIRSPQPGISMRNQQPGTAGSFASHLNQIPAYMMLPKDQASQSSSQTNLQTHVTKLHAEILRNVSRNMSMRTAGARKTSIDSEYRSLQQNIHQRDYMDYKRRCNAETLDASSKPISLNIPPPSQTTLSRPLESRGSKRGYDHAMGQMQNHDKNTSTYPSLLQQSSQLQESERRNSRMGVVFSKDQKKLKIQNGIHSEKNGMPCGIIDVEDGPDHSLQKCLNSVSVTEFASKTDACLVRRSANNEKCIIVPPTPPRKAPVLRDQSIVSLTHVSEMQIVESTQIPSSRSRAKEKQKRSLQYLGKARGATEELSYRDSVGEIIYGLQNLSLADKGSEQMEQNALVLYQRDGEVVPYEIKKRKPRPKVDLDQETTRIWNLLMGKGESQGDQEMDKEKEKWWEEERGVFRGRANSFIARMHLVQGDRRFSPWKGSVVDSVIGVFLTQNVTDHLSSSAFMSLAARFPPKSNHNLADERNTASILVEDPDGCILNLNDIPEQPEKIIHHPPDTPVSGVESGSKEQQRDNSNNLVERISNVDYFSHNSEEEVLSSQDSFDPTTFLSSGRVRSCSGSTSDAEFSTNRCEPKSVRGSVKLLQIGDPTLCDEFCCQGNGRQLLCEVSEHLQVQETANNAQKKPGEDRVSNFKETLSFCHPDTHNNWQLEVPTNPSGIYQQNVIPQLHVLDREDFRMHGESNSYSWQSIAPRIDDGNYKSGSHNQVRRAENVAMQSMCQNEKPGPRATPGLGSCMSSSKDQMHQGDIYISGSGSYLRYNQLCNHRHNEMNKVSHLQNTFTDQLNSAEECVARQSSSAQHVSDALLADKRTCAAEVVNLHNKNGSLKNKLFELNSGNQDLLTVEYKETNSKILQETKGKPDDGKKSTSHWDSLRKDVEPNGRRKERSKDTLDSINYESLRNATVGEISEAIKERGMNNMLAMRIKEFLDRLVKDHDSIDLEWLRDVPADKAKDYLLSIRGLGLKSVECVRLLTLHNLAFPVDTNVGRIAVRLGWVPLQPLPESLQLHLLELYPVLESIQKYLWPRLCKLDQRTLYELHYQLITFGKVFCTKSKPNCNACPLRGECRHFASAFASARLALPAPKERSLTGSTIPVDPPTIDTAFMPPMQLSPSEGSIPRETSNGRNNEPIIEEPATPEQECAEVTESDIEDAYDEDPDEIPTIKLNIEEFGSNLQQYMELQEVDMSKALVALNQSAASIPTPKLKNISRLRTEHQVYELPDSHPLLHGMEKREPDDPSPYLLAIWTPGETATSTQLPERKCELQEPGKLCNDQTCATCNSVREANSHTVRGTLLIPCRTAMRGSFPLNGTYFQVNEVFADHDSSLNPIDVPRDWIWNLPRRIVYFGTSVTSIFRGLSTEQIQHCFWRGFVCVRGFEHKTRAPRPLVARLHFPASRLKAKTEVSK